MAGAAVTRGSLAGWAETSCAAPARLGSVGIQVYTVRSLLKTDFDGTLSRLADLGYKDLEWWGTFGHTPEQIRDTLAKTGQRTPSAHFDYGDIRDHTDKVLAQAEVLQHDYVTAAWIDQKERATLADWQRIAEQFNKVGERLKASGQHFAYHNHNYEFPVVEGKQPLDLLLENTDPALVAFEMDIYWLVSAGADPVAYIRKYPGRFQLFHVKDSAGAPTHAMVDVGSGTIDFAAVFRAAVDHGNSLKYAFVEHDEPADPLVFAEHSMTYLKKLEY